MAFELQALSSPTPSGQYHNLHLVPEADVPLPARHERPLNQRQRLLQPHRHHRLLRPPPGGPPPPSTLAPAPAPARPAFRLRLGGIESVEHRLHYAQPAARAGHPDPLEGADGVVPVHGPRA